jgi:hypothetical protein
MELGGGWEALSAVEEPAVENLVYQSLIQSLFPSLRLEQQPQARKVLHFLVDPCAQGWMHSPTVQLMQKAEALGELMHLLQHTLPLDDLLGVGLAGEWHSQAWSKVSVAPLGRALWYPQKSSGVGGALETLEGIKNQQISKKIHVSPG